MSIRASLASLVVPALLVLVAAPARAAGVDLSSGHITGDTAALIEIVLSPGQPTWQRFCFVTATSAPISNPTAVEYAEYRCVKHVLTTHEDPNTGLYDEITVELSDPLSVDAAGYGLLSQIAAADQAILQVKNEFFDFLYRTQPRLTDPRIAQAYDTDPNYHAQYDAWLTNELQRRGAAMNQALDARAQLDAALVQQSKPVQAREPAGSDGGVLGHPI